MIAAETKESPPTSEEVELYYTKRELLPADRLAVLNKYAANLPHAERAYQEFRASQARVDQELDDAIRDKRKE